MSELFSRLATFHPGVAHVVAVLPEYRGHLACAKYMSGMSELDMVQKLAGKLLKRAMRYKKGGLLQADNTGFRYDTKEAGFAIRRLGRRRRFVITVIIKNSMPLERRTALVQQLQKKGSGWKLGIMD